MGINVSDETYQEWVRKGLVSPPSASSKPPTPDLTTKPRKTRKKDLLQSLFLPPSTWVVGIETVSEANIQGARGQMQRKAAQKRAVTQLLGRNLRALVPFSEAFHAGRAIHVKITRLGGRGLDTGNLWRALKATEDAIETMLGANDGSPLWKMEPLQEDNPKLGVRIELSLETPNEQGTRGQEETQEAILQEYGSEVQTLEAGI